MQKLSKKESARLGGLTRVKHHGSAGTLESRRRGGEKSLISHKKKGTGFIQLQDVARPLRSEQYAEFLGIMFGDGHVSRYQASVTTNAETDIAHAYYIYNLAHSIFKIEPSFRLRRDSKGCTITLNSRLVCDFLEREGIPRGNKIKMGMKIPHWICKNKLYRQMFVRGLFDTDGCVFLDRHTIKGVRYQNMGIAFANKSPVLLKYFSSTLEDIGFHPTQTTPFRVFLRRSKEIDLYFKIIGSSNCKHLERYHNYQKLINGGVA